MCNLNCRYCFYRDITKKREQSSYGLMTEETLEAVIQKGLSYAGQDCTIAFQGGEPTLAGLDFYKTVVELEKKHNKKGVRVHNAIQTNGIGLDAAWADFFRDNNFLLRGLVRNDREFDSPTNSQFSEPQNDTERVREGTTTDHVRHDLSAATRRQIPIYLFAL